MLDPNVLTLGFARRFVEYKRPNLLLHDVQRLVRLLLNPRQPVQIIIAGKAHPEDEEGRQLVHAWLQFVNQPQVRARAVFLEDYDIALAQQLVQGVDLWINTPRRPWEACGTSGMKVLVNGGLNLSTLDGWWAEAYVPEVGWAINVAKGTRADADAADAEELYRILECEAVPLFYERDARDIPVGWVKRMRASMSALTPLCSSNRMLRNYLEQFYRPCAEEFRVRSSDKARLARAINEWDARLAAGWHELHFGRLSVEQHAGEWRFEVQAYLSDIAPEWVQVELYADPAQECAAVCQAMTRGEPISGAINGYVYGASVPATRPHWNFTPRIRGYHEHAETPIESAFVLWQR